MTLWFHLDEDINKLNDSNSLSIANDSNGYDKEFEIENVDFKHGALIIRYTDHENNIVIEYFTLDEMHGDSFESYIDSLGLKEVGN